MGSGGRRDPREYIEITAEVFYCHVKGRKRVRAVHGEAYPPSMNIECSKKIRELPLGTKIRLQVVVTDREGSSFLYSSYKWPYKLVE